MNTKNYFQKASHIAMSFHSLPFRSLALSALILTGIQAPLRAQTVTPQFTQPSWWVGAAAAVNVNFYDGTTQQLSPDLTVPAAFHHGQGIGFYLAPLVEYHFTDSKFGIMLQAGYDGRNGVFEHVITPCNCRGDLNTNLAYLTVEPSLRFTPFRSNSRFYLYGGPRVAFNIASDYTYKIQTNPDLAEPVTATQTKGDFSNMNHTVISMQIGAGYDFLVGPQNQELQKVLSPFVAFQPYFGQNPRTMETWTVTTLRIGAAYKWGRGNLITQPVAPAEAAVVFDPQFTFSVSSPKNIPVERRVRETFPLRNYVFFNVGSTEIPDRYVLLSKDQVKDFKEDQLEVFTPKKLSGRSDREMIVYYNVLNILGDRMGKNPSATINLVGSSLKGPVDGEAMAQSIKKYLVDVFGIAPARIKTEGRKQPKIPSEQPGGTRDLDLLREGDNRVSIESNSPALLMEFQSGPSAPLKAVDIVAVQDAPFDSYVSFNVAGAVAAFTSWSLEVKNSEGVVQYFGPYTQETVRIPGKTILGTQPEGDFKVTMIGHLRNNTTSTKEANVHMVLWTPPKDEEGQRFSVIYEFNKSKSIAIYEKYLTDVVAPKIPVGATVIIHGHTDIIGDAAENKTLSVARANDVRNILDKALAKAGRSDVNFSVYGFGEDQSSSPFENNYPEERFYNRTVIIDIIPKN